MPLLLASVLTFLSGSLGSELRRDGYSVRPPSDFRMTRVELFHATRAGAISFTPDAPGSLSAALVDGSGEDAASMVVSVVEGSFSASPAARDAFSSAVLKHFSDQLGLKVALDRVELVSGAAERVEVLGTIRQENQVRHVLAAAMAGEGRHIVILFSIPLARWESLAPTLRASLDTFRNETPSAKETLRGVAGAFAALFATALVASLLLWRRRSHQRVSS